MTKIVLFAAVLLFNYVLCAQTATQPSGDGTSSSPYLIKNLNNLYWISQNSGSWNKHFKQTADIDASPTATWFGGSGFIPISDVYTKFSGDYNGNGHTISGLYINRSGNSDVGLFGYVTGYIENLGLINEYVKGSDVTGGLAGHLIDPGIIRNSYTTGSVIETSTAGGGFVGFNGGQIFNCYSRCSVTGTQLYPYYIGGFIGDQEGTAQYCYSTGLVTAINGYNIGGFEGLDNGGTYFSFWDKTTSGQETDPGEYNGLGGRTTDKMKTLSTFTSSSSQNYFIPWDFVNNPYDDTANEDIWDMDTTNKIINDGYPFLSWQNGSAVALPVELTAFSASVIENKIELKWKTETEVNNYGFEIQRSEVSNQKSVLSSWEKIGFVKGNGNSNSPKDYSFVDEKPLSGKAEYRLKQVDNDGVFKYSSVVRVNSLPAEFELFQNYPNPFNPTTTIRYSIPKTEHVTLKIYDELGNEITTLVDENKEAGNYEVQFNAQQTTNNKQLASGIYYYRITAIPKGRQAGEFTDVKKLILLK